MNNGKHDGEENIRTVISESLETAKEALEEQAAKLKDKMEDLDLSEVPGEIKTYIRKSPWKSLAIAIGLGFLAGYVLKSNNKDQ